jgi:hypothetical protein
MKCSNFLPIIATTFLSSCRRQNVNRTVLMLPLTFTVGLLCLEAQVLSHSDGTAKYVSNSITTVSFSIFMSQTRFLAQKQVYELISFKVTLLLYNNIVCWLFMLRKSSVFDKISGNKFSSDRLTRL